MQKLHEKGTCIKMHELLQEFHNVVNHEVNLRKQGSSKLTYSPFEQSPSEWRKEWVNVFSALCEPLYRFVDLHSPSSISLSAEDARATLNCFDRFCGKTSMNHLLDANMSVFLICDCLVSLVLLVDEIVEPRYTKLSFHFQRISSYRHIQTQIMVHKGFWKDRSESDRDEYLKAIQEVPFPFEKYCNMSDWKRVS